MKQEEWDRRFGLAYYPSKKKKKKKKTKKQTSKRCMLVWYCNLNIGRQLIDHLPFLFHYPIDLHIVFLTSLSTIQFSI